MASGRSRVERDSDIHAPHPFFFFFFSYLFSLLEGLEPTRTPVSPGPQHPIRSTCPHPGPFRSPHLSPPVLQAQDPRGPRGARPSTPRLFCGSPTCRIGRQRCPGLTGREQGDLTASRPPSTSQALAVLTGGHAPDRVQGPGATAVGREPGAAARRGEPRRGGWSRAS